MDQIQAEWELMLRVATPIYVQLLATEGQQRVAVDLAEAAVARARTLMVAAVQDVLANEPAAAMLGVED
jgi:arginine/ornithine N-succinyltransferase beta subunit